VAPVGILYRNDDVPCYEDVRSRDKAQTPEMIEEALNEEFDNFTVDPVL
jgi:2-oxoglutarate ferredoxin oxidoreductase subunit beta